jgi:AcrR family transcriptional regulator
MRDRIKEAAIPLLVTHGVSGMSFAQIAMAIPTTRANIHYHFKNKMSLVEEVIADYVAASTLRLRTIWTDPSTTFQKKLTLTHLFNRERYLLFNNADSYGRPWSLITRMRADRDALSEAATKPLRQFMLELVDMISAGVQISVSNGDLNAQTPKEDLTRQLANLINSAGAIVDDAGGFESLDRLYMSFLRLVEDAYGISN